MYNDQIFYYNLDPQRQPIHNIASNPTLPVTLTRGGLILILRKGYNTLGRPILLLIVVQSSMAHVGINLSFIDMP